MEEYEAPISAVHMIVRPTSMHGRRVRGNVCRKIPTKGEEK